MSSGSRVTVLHMTSLRHNQTPDPGPTRDPRDLYLDAATAVSGSPLRPIVAKLRLSGDKFDLYLSNAALAASDNDVVAQLYLAAKTEGVISDFGATLYADAADV